jgi:hypothetical protein
MKTNHGARFIVIGTICLILASPLCAQNTNPSPKDYSGARNLDHPIS